MIIPIYKVLRDHNFTSKGHCKQTNKDLDIKMTFTDKYNRWVEVRKMFDGYDVVIFGEGFFSRNSCLPWTCYIEDNHGLKLFENELKLKLNEAR